MHGIMFTLMYPYNISHLKKLFSSSKTREGGGGGLGCVCRKVKDMGPFWASSE